MPLLKSSITNIVIHSDDWFAGRLAKFTSSECHFLMGESSVTDAGKNYIFRKVGEEITGRPCMKEISTDATEHGLQYENEGLIKFGQQMGIEFLVTQKLIRPVDGRESSTPDAIWIQGVNSDDVSYKVATCEIKCPTAFDNYINLWNCNTPNDVKKANKKYYWQVIHQMRVCGALKGYFIVYQPFFRFGGIKVVEFKKIDLVPEFTLMNQRLTQAEQIFIEQRDKMIA